MFIAAPHLGVMNRIPCLMAGVMLLAACTSESTETAVAPVDDYHVTGNCAMTLSQEDQALKAAKHAEPGVTMVELSNGYSVFTQQYGESEDVKVLVLHGGPACTHEYMLNVAYQMPGHEGLADVGDAEVHMYDQLGSFYSDQPSEDLWNIERWVEEVDEVRRALGMDSTNFYLLGNSNGGSMVQRLGCDHPERFAAVAIMIYQMPPGHACGPEQPLPMFHYYGDLDDGVPADGQPSPYGWIYTSAKENTRIWAEAMACEGPAVSWQTPLTREHGLHCEAFSRCGREGAEVVSCGDPLAGHEWQAQRILAIPSDCVAPAQAQDLPRQPRCPAMSSPQALWGMEVVWQFLSRYSS